MKTLNKFIALLFFVCLISGCELFNKDEINKNDLIIEMAWLKEDGSISDAITSDFLMVHKDGLEKAFFHDNYLVSIFDSANEQSYSISFFDSTKAYVPSRIVSGDFEFNISNFNESTFTFDMTIMYSGSKSLKNTYGDKTVIKVFDQKFDPDTELVLLKLKKYIYGDNNYKGTLQIAGYLNILRVGMADAVKALEVQNQYWEAVFNRDTGKIKLADITKNKDFSRLINYKFRTAFSIGIIKSILQNVVTDSDYLGKYGNEVSLLLNGAFTIASCAGTAGLTLGLGCAIAVENFAIDAYDYYQKTYRGLDGDWESIDLELRISGSSATFTNIKSGLFLIGKDAGLLPLGSEYLKNITETNDLEWSCSCLWLCVDSSYVAREVGWVSSASIKMYSDHNTIKLYRDLPGSQYCPNSATRISTFKRKSIK